MYPDPCERHSKQIKIPQVGSQKDGRNFSFGDIPQGIFEPVGKDDPFSAFFGVLVIVEVLCQRADDVTNGLVGELLKL